MLDFQAFARLSETRVGLQIPLVQRGLLVSSNYQIKGTVCFVRQL